MGDLLTSGAELRLLRHGRLRRPRDPRRHWGHARSVRHVLSTRDAPVTRRAVVALRAWAPRPVGRFDPMAPAFGGRSRPRVASRATRGVASRRGYHRGALRDMAA